MTTCLARLQVWHEYPAPEVAGLIEVDGDIVDLADGVDIYALIGADLVLQLHDGRSLPFFFMDSLGRIASRGALAKGGA